MVPNVTENPIDIARMINNNATFTCTATGIPLPNITWTDQDGNTVGITSDMIINGTTILSTLTLSNLQDDDFDNYTCTATNIFGSDDVSALLGSELLVITCCNIRYCKCTMKNPHKSFRIIYFKNQTED